MCWGYVNNTNAFFPKCAKFTCAAYYNTMVNKQWNLLSSYNVIRKKIFIEIHFK